ncbi:hypothetical protein OOK41_00085 [Micromonospora sp. NBC_01655]|uniref:hypothetical protein n=1 Tax=Micromonospora sp. NBC_01655 TaxID=2975983 RepID=UPI002253681B|nr:hypothetical protein [Micromonospora sp. NBC_01655]MCX4468729.1 hypothetical protein [Micromonospora sp. NBC_01655]
MQVKALRGVEIKDVDKGTVEAVFSTFNVIDSDRDVTLPGAFEDGAPWKISAYGHRSWMGVLPVGKGTVRTTNTEAILDGQFFMDTTHGRDTFATVKAMGELQEWSYSVHPTKESYGEFEGRQVRFLEQLGPAKVCTAGPLGAGIGTRTPGNEVRRRAAAARRSKRRWRPWAWSTARDDQRKRKWALSLSEASPCHGSTPMPSPASVTS